MSACNRFEEEFLQQLEEGRPLDPHVETCADCTRARAQYERLFAELRAAPRPKAPAGWEARVQSKLAPRRSWVPYLAAACVLAGAFALLKLREPRAFELEVIHDASHTLRSGADDLRAGDTLRLSADTGAQGGLRVWQGDKLIYSCAPCSRAEVKVPAAGTVQAIAIASSRPLPPPAPTPNEDSERLIAAGARLSLAPVLRAY